MSYDDWLKADGEGARNANGLFLRLSDDGDRDVIALLGRPMLRKTHWVGRRTENCIGSGCLHCTTGKPTTRVVTNVAVESGGFWSCKILELSFKFTATVKSVGQKYPIDSTAFELCRSGAAGDPSTRYDLLFDRSLSESELNEIRGLQLHDLTELCGGSNPSESPQPLSDSTPF